MLMRTSIPEFELDEATTEVMEAVGRVRCVFEVNATIHRWTESVLDNSLEMIFDDLHSGCAFNCDTGEETVESAAAYKSRLAVYEKYFSDTALDLIQQLKSGLVPVPGATGPAPGGVSVGAITDANADPSDSGAYASEKASARAARFAVITNTFTGRAGKAKTSESTR